MSRPEHVASHPLHVTLRARGVGYLRSQRLFPKVRDAIGVASLRVVKNPGRGDLFRILEFSVQGDHVHLVVEVADKRCLSRGVAGLCIRIARSVNAELGRKGPLWRDRYHARALTTPRAVRAVLVYVLMNHKKHLRADLWKGDIDSCSSAPWFKGFAEAILKPRLASVTSSPATWLARMGWRRGGLISLREGPRKEQPHAAFGVRQCRRSLEYMASVSR